MRDVYKLHRRVNERGVGRRNPQHNFACGGAGGGGGDRKCLATCRSDPLSGGANVPMEEVYVACFIKRSERMLFCGLRIFYLFIFSLLFFIFSLYIRPHRPLRRFRGGGTSALLLYWPGI